MLLYLYRVCSRALFDTQMQCKVSWAVVLFYSKFRGLLWAWHEWRTGWHPAHVTTWKLVTRAKQAADREALSSWDYRHHPSLIHAAWLWHVYHWYQNITLSLKDSLCTDKAQCMPRTEFFFNTVNNGLCYTVYFRIGWCKTSSELSEFRKVNLKAIPWQTKFW